MKNTKQTEYRITEYRGRKAPQHWIATGPDELADIILSNLKGSKIKVEEVE